VDVESTKIVHQFSVGDKISGLTCMGWASSLTSRKRSEVGSKNDSASWMSLLGENPVLSENKVSLDLPRDLALIDIETSLPKLSVLPAGGNSSVTRPSLRDYPADKK
jgi:anaphase-promoting complex subunit 4